MPRALAIYLLTIAVCVMFTPASLAVPGGPFADIDKVAELALTDWRGHLGDVAGAEAPDFDDAAWDTVSPGFEWTGDNTIYWVRKRVILPAEMSGKRVAGQPLYFLTGFDDGGTIFVNGEERQEFNWDGGKALVTESAQPGQSYVIAVRAVNHPGPGRFFFASLSLGGTRTFAQALLIYRDRMNMIRPLATEKPDHDPDLARAYARARELLDPEALPQEDSEEVRRALKEAIAVLSPHIKRYTVYAVGHAHIDMNWLWLWPETVQVCKDTFSEMLQRMVEFPDFKFSQSQAATYLAMQDYHPNVLTAIRRRAAEGRWDVTAGTWVEGDMNMPSGEAIVRQMMYSKRYFRDKFNLGFDDIRMCWEPDTFGHAWSVPQIMRKAGLEDYFFHRCGPGPVAFWWQGIDGSRVLAYCSPRGYGEGIDNGTADLVFRLGRDLNLRESMAVYGRGDHGGGPRAQDIERVIEFNDDPLMPTAKFARAEDFYHRVREAKRELPVIDRELNFTFEGCYTTHSDVKRWNRESENMLPAAEAFSAVATGLGVPYPKSDFVTAWRHTCFDQFHDIFDGSAIHDSYAYSQGLYDESRKVWETALDRSLGAIAAAIDVPQGLDAIVVFNPLPWRRTDVVRLPTAEHRRGMDQCVTVSGPDGTRVPCQIIAKEGAPPELVFIARDVPATGYAVYRVGEMLDCRLPVGYTGTLTLRDEADAIVLGNEFFTVRVDRNDGTITGLRDERAKREVLPTGARANVMEALFERPHGMSAWNIGPIANTEALTGPAEVTIGTRGPAQVSVVVTRHWRDSDFRQEIILRPGVPRIDLAYSVDWHELGSNNIDAPMIKASFPAALEGATATFEIPDAAIERPANGHEVPAQKWIDLSAGDYGVSLLNNCKYGHDVNGQVMRVTLLRSSYDPDPRPDFGHHEILLALYPHAGDWRQAGSVRRGYELNNPLIARQVEPHAGERPARWGFVEALPDNIIVTAVKRSEDGNDLIVRLYECTGKATRARLRVNFKAGMPVETDLLERPIEGRPIKNEGAAGYVFEVKPWEIVTLRFRGG
jgi:alpha-mannosidase